MAAAIAAARPLMLTYSPRPITPQIIAALEQIESPAPAVRDAALKSISALLRDVTLAELFTRILDQAALAAPWWQLTAQYLLDCHRPRLSPAGLEFCERLSCQPAPPATEDEHMLQGLHDALRGV